MSVIAPSLTYATSAEYTAYMDKLVGIAERSHIDLSDGILAPVRSISLPQAWWPDGMIADVHLMYKRPVDATEQLVSMKPHLVTVHAEADGDLIGFGGHLQKFGIRFGVAIMPDTDVTAATPLLTIADHLLIFSGRLGYYGGTADPARFAQIATLKKLYPNAEIGWDGGANESNVHAIAHAGVDVITVGSGLSGKSDVGAAYAKLVSELTNV